MYNREAAASETATLVGMIQTRLNQKIAITRTDEATHGAYRADVPGAERQAELTWTARGKVRVRST